MASSSSSSSGPKSGFKAKAPEPRAIKMPDLSHFRSEALVAAAKAARDTSDFSKGFGFSPKPKSTPGAVIEKYYKDPEVKKFVLENKLRPHAYQYLNEFAILMYKDKAYSALIQEWVGQTSAQPITLFGLYLAKATGKVEDLSARSTGFNIARKMSKDPLENQSVVVGRRNRTSGEPIELDLLNALCIAFATPEHAGFPHGCNLNLASAYAFYIEQRLEDNEERAQLMRAVGGNAAAMQKAVVLIKSAKKKSALKAADIISRCTSHNISVADWDASLKGLIA
jgi:hypothetical protein